jgi:hypothetical protein
LCSTTHHGIAGVDQPMQHADQLLDVGHVQADGRFVEHVERVQRRLARRAAVGAREFRDELDALRLAARERRARLAERQVAETDVLQQRSAWCMRGCAAKNGTASSTLIASTSPMLRSRQVTASVSALKRRPPQTSQAP